ncbi:MAG: FAD binding domain-containing protein, partial [Bacteroidota bacterium]
MIAEKKYIKTNTVEEAVTAAKANGDNFCFLAGGTDVLVNKFQGTEEATCLIDITGIEELKQVAKCTLEGVLSPSGRAREGLK